MRSPLDDCLPSSLTEVHATDEMFGASSFLTSSTTPHYFLTITESGLKPWKTSGWTPSAPHAPQGEKGGSVDKVETA